MALAQGSNNVFNQDIWNVGIQKSLEKESIFDKWCEKKYEGDLKKVGDQVRILSSGNVNTKKLNWSLEADRKTFESALGDPDKRTGAEVTLQVNQIVYYQVEVNDIEELLSDPSKYADLQTDASYQIKDEMDSYVAGKAVDFPYYNTNSIAITVNNILKTVASMKTMLLKKNVPSSTQLKAEVPFEFMQLLREAYENLSTDNVELLKTGNIVDSTEAGVYQKMIFESSNNVYHTTSNSVDTYHIMLRTKRALAFVKRVGFSEKIRNQNGFSDILRGYAFYDAKVVRPKEGLTLKCTINTATEKLSKVSVDGTVTTTTSGT